MLFSGLVSWGSSLSIPGYAVFLKMAFYTGEKSVSGSDESKNLPYLFFMFLSILILLVISMTVVLFSSMDI